ncbi:MAG TPA: serine/threonine-protein kinase, partial [Myxococcota bacterium]
MVDPSEKTEVIAGDARLVQRIGRYRLERRLGAGGMAEVFLARAEGPLGFEKQVVIKRIRPQLVAQPRFVEMFLREARMLAGLDHPNIVRIIELDEDKGEYFLALEYLEGLSLREVAERHWSAGRSLPIEPIITIVADAALGLEHAHNYRDQTGQPANLVHRDVSPDNLFVTTSGTVKVIDFGIAKRDGLDQLTQNGELKGKVPFMAPEHLNGLTLDARADLFSLGVVLYWLLTGRRPFDGVTDVHTMKAILEDPPRAPRALNPKLPSVLEEIALSLLEKNRDRRMKNAGLLHDALMSLIVGLPRGAPQPADLVGFAQRVPASEHEIVPAGIAAAPSLSWPMTPIGTLNDNGDDDDDAALPTRIGFVPPPVVASSRAAPRTHESIPRPRVSDTEEGGYAAPATELIDKQSVIDVSTDEHKRSHPSGPSSSNPPSLPPSDPIIDVERV